MDGAVRKRMWRWFNNEGVDLFPFSVVFFLLRSLFYARTRAFNGFFSLQLHDSFRGCVIMVIGEVAGKVEAEKGTPRHLEIWWGATRPAGGDGMRRRRCTCPRCRCRDGPRRWTPPCRRPGGWGNCWFPASPCRSAIWILCLSMERRNTLKPRFKSGERRTAVRKLYPRQLWMNWRRTMALEFAARQTWHIYFSNTVKKQIFCGYSNCGRLRTGGGMTIHLIMPFFVKILKSARTSIVIPDDFHATALAGLEREDVGGSVEGIPAVEVWVALAFVTSDCFCKSVMKDESKKAKDCTHFERKKKPVKSVLNHVWLNWKTRGEGVAPSVVVARRKLRKMVLYRYKL